MNEQSRIVLHTWSAYHSVAVTGMARDTCITRYMFMEVRNCLAFGLLYQSVAVTGMARYTCIARYMYKVYLAVHGGEELSCVWSAVPECGCQGYGKGTI